ncbi:hypothetical protein [Streptomyces shenzhenensis]|uniref:hypothetical protein n=1 Tax=Streptomyces shenzhenensis TaxID=943815 RepID=UPI003680D29F
MSSRLGILREKQLQMLSSRGQGVAVIGAEIELPIADGVLSGVGFGGHSEGVLLVHGSGRRVRGDGRRREWSGARRPPRIADGVVLDDRDTAFTEHAAVRTTEAADRLLAIGRER